MLKLGEKIISDIYLGDKKIAKAFLGDKLVYQAGEPIFLDYIHFDGASYINTGILYPDGCDGTWTVKGKANIDGVFRVLIATKAYGGCYYGKGSNDKWGLGSTYYFDVNGDVLTEAQVVFRENGIQATIDGITLIRKAGQDTSVTIKLGGTSLKADLDSYFIGDVYGCKYVDINNNLIQDLRPCIDPKGTVCFYDMVTKKYFYNQGTGTFTAGNIIQFVDYIEFDGNSYIDTGISYQDCIVECGLICPATSARELMGWAPDASTYWGITNGQFELGGGYALTKSDTTKYSEVKIEVVISDKRYLTLSHAGNSIKRAGNIGGGTYNYAIGAMPYTYSYGFIGNIYFHRFINPNGVLMQDLRPCLFNGVACFYDMVTGNLFYNQGTGTLKAGGEINLASFTIMGTATIDNGIVSNISETSYITTKTNYGLPTASSWSIIFPTIKVNEISKYFWGTNAERSGIVLAVNSTGKIVVYISSNGTQWDIASGINNLYSNLEFSKGEDVDIRLDFTGSKYVLYILKDNAWQEQTSVTSSLKVGYFEHFRIGQWTNYYRFDSTMDLKTFTVVADGKVTSALK